MSVSGTQKESSISSFAGVGTLTGAAFGRNVINKHYDKLADKTVMAFDGTLNNADKFFKKNCELLSEAANSNKGFFGKINKVIGESAEELSWSEKIEQGAEKVVNEYRTKAKNTLIKKGTPEDLLDEGIRELSNKKMSKAISKSIKNVKQNKIIGTVLAFAVAGTLLFNGISKAVKKPKPQHTANLASPASARSVKANKKLV